MIRNYVYLIGIAVRPAVMLEAPRWLFHPSLRPPLFQEYSFEKQNDPVRALPPRRRTFLDFLTKLKNTHVFF